MAKRRMFTKRSRVLGLPIGKRRRDWRKLGLVGAGLASTVASGLGAKQAGQALSRRDADAEGTDESQDSEEQGGRDDG